MSHRKEQVRSTLARTVAEVLQRDLSDPRLEGALVGVTEVELADDMRNATVRVSVVPEKAEKRVIAALAHGSSHIRALVRKRMAARIVPQLEFRLDEGLKRATQVYRAINEAKDRTGPEKPPATDDAPAV